MTHPYTLMGRFSNPQKRDQAVFLQTQASHIGLEKLNRVVLTGRIQSWQERRS